MLIYIATLVCLAGQLADWYSTKWGLSKGGKEISRLPAWTLKHFGIWGLFAVKALLGIAPLLLNLAISLPIPLAIGAFSAGALGAWDAYQNYKKLRVHQS